MTESRALDCEAMDHVGPVRDATVEWRALGLMCDTCYEAFGDTRPLRAVLKQIAAFEVDPDDGWDYSLGVMRAMAADALDDPGKAGTDD
jgi:hypothetical protein